MIHLENVTKSFPNGVVALESVSIHIGQDEFVFLVGPSGAGKTTLLTLLYRESSPTGGRVVVDRIDVAALESRHIPFLRRSMGVVFQDYKLLPRRTVHENVAFALQVTGARRSEIRLKTAQALELVGLAEKARSFPDQLSGGEKQRVCIARAIVNNPTILLADEPTGNLDPSTSWDIMELLNKINKRHTTVVVATHNKNIVDGMRKRVVQMDGGHVTRDERLGAYSAS